MLTRLILALRDSKTKSPTNLTCKIPDTHATVTFCFVSEGSRMTNEGDDTVKTDCDVAQRNSMETFKGTV